MTAVSDRPSARPLEPTATPARSLRLLFFYDATYPESLGGVEHRNFQLAGALARRGHRVTIAGWFRDAPVAEAGVEYLRLPGRASLYNPEGRRSTLAAVRLALAAARLNLSRFDAIESANIPYIHLFPLAARAAFQRRPLFVTWHEYWGSYWREYVGRAAWPLYAGLEWLAAQTGTQTLAVSDFTAERLRRRRLRRQAVPVSPNGIPLARIREVATAEPGPPLVYAGRLLREKRIDLLLDAVALLPDTDTPLLTIIGTGPDEARLRQLATNPAVRNRVHFTGRLPAPEDVWRTMSAAKVAVQPSSREGFGMFPLEAMALGLPVVYCESGESALSELVRHDVEGIETAATPAALAATIGRLLEAPGEVARLAHAARLRAEDYDWDTIAERFEHLVDQQTGNREPGTHRAASASANRSTM